MARKCPKCECMVDASGFCPHCCTHTMTQDNNGYVSSRLYDSYESYLDTANEHPKSYFFTKWRKLLFSMYKK